MALFAAEKRDGYYSESRKTRCYRSLLFSFSGLFLGASPLFVRRSGWRAIVTQVVPDLAVEFLDINGC